LEELTIFFLTSRSVQYLIVSVKLGENAGQMCEKAGDPGEYPLAKNERIRTLVIKGPRGPSRRLDPWIEGDIPCEASS
jgi:hypothetical protein